MEAASINGLPLLLTVLAVVPVVLLGASCCDGRRNGHCAGSSLNISSMRDLRVGKTILLHAGFFKCLFLGTPHLIAMKRNATAPCSVDADGCSSSVSSSNGTLNALAGRPPFLFTCANGTSGRRFHAAARAAKPPKAGPPNIASQSLSSTLGLFPRAGTSPLHTAPSISQNRTAVVSLVAPQPDRAGDDGVKIKTRDPTNVSRRTAIKQSCDLGPGPQLKSGVLSQVHSSSTFGADVQPLRALRQHPVVHLLGWEATDGHSQLSDQGSNGHAAAIQPPTSRLVSSQMMQQHLSPISEAANASFSSRSFSRDVAYEGSGDDGCDIRDSALYTLSPSASQQDLQGPSHSHQSYSLASSCSMLPPQVHSPVQRQANPIFDAHNGDTLVQNMNELLADPAPMQVPCCSSILQSY